MSKNMYTNRNTHDTNCHRNYGRIQIRMLLPLVRLSRQIEPMILTMIIWEKSASANDQTGLIPSEYTKMMTKLNLIRMCFLLRHRLLKRISDSLS